MSARTRSRFRFGLTFTVGFVLGGLAGLLLFRGSGEAANSPGAARPGAARPAPPQVPVTAVLEQTVPVYLEYVGTTDAIRSVTLEAQVTGYLVRHAAADGADVRKGQLLYQIDPRAYQAALDSVQAQAQRDAAAHEYAAANHRRDLGLNKTGDVSEDALQQATSTEHQDAAAQAADRAAIESAQLNLGYTAIRAPFAGRLSRTQVNEGALITVAGTQLNTLVQLDPIYATFNPPQADLARIEAAQATHPIPVQVLVGNGAPAYQGTLTFLDNSVDRTTGTITARATVANPRRSLLPGQFVRVRLHVADQANTLLIPQVAVSSSQLGQYVFIVGADDKAQQRYVTLGTNYGPLVAVTKGLTAGESVVIGDLLQLNPGTQISPVTQSPPRATGP